MQVDVTCLPVPKGMYALAGAEMPVRVTQEENTMQLEDAVDGEVVQQRDSEALRALAFSCRSQAMQRLMPRPPAAADMGALRVTKVAALQSAEYTLLTAITGMISHDAARYSMQGKLCRKRLPVFAKLLENGPSGFEAQFDARYLQSAATLLATECAHLKEKYGHFSASPRDVTNQLRDATLEYQCVPAGQGSGTDYFMQTLLHSAPVVTHVAYLERYGLSDRTN